MARVIEVEYHSNAQMQPGANPGGAPQSRFVVQLKVNRAPIVEAIAKLNTLVPDLMNGSPEVKALWAQVVKAAGSEYGDALEIQGHIATVLGRMLGDDAHLPSVRTSQRVV